MKAEDLSGAIFQIDKLKPTELDKKNVDEKFYGLGSQGQAKVCPHFDEKVCAKDQRQQDNSRLYFLRLDEGGVNIYNPISQGRMTLGSRDALGTMRIQWVKVDKEGFDNYIKFLGTRNDTYLSLAQRKVKAENIVKNWT